MLKTIRIANFRGFQSFELQQLGRVNLLVGTNNSGKTSVLEAIQLLNSGTQLNSLHELMANRGEYLRDDDDQINRELDVCRLFYGYEIKPGSKFLISGINDNHEEKLTVSIRDLGSSSYAQIGELSEQHRGFGSAIEWVHSQAAEPLELPLSVYGGLSTNHILKPLSYSKWPKAQFITSSSIASSKMMDLFDQVVLTPEETLVQEALQIIEPNIERIAVVSSKRYGSLDIRMGFVVRLRDREQRIPIGNLGDGTWRILGLALAIVCAKGKVLLVDEIDTGLHFTTMSSMWKLIWKTAKKLDVQVFATTHNSDCWTSLASIASQEHDLEDGITIQRIEKGKQTAVSFSESEIVIAAERGIEVR
ncbi:MAG: AAA family ATPase [Cyanothece sp. SIO1E1]|nr:AAA family ATPase [Cyanothece sp. SIO1E1]